MASFWTWDNFVYLAFAIQALAFMCRDELWLRILIIVGAFLYMVFYYFAADAPLWAAIVTTAVLAVINVVFIVVIVMERTTLTMTPEETALYAHMQTLTPGQFRSIMKEATWTKDNNGPVVLTREGEPIGNLFFVLSGTAQIGKGDTSGQIEGNLFIGEIAFLTRGPASATVTVGSGATLVSWRHEALDALFVRKPAIKNAVLALFNLDLAAKVAASAPVVRSVG